eukprot:6366769-Prymnesium_polylepis.2
MPLLAKGGGMMVRLLAKSSHWSSASVTSTLYHATGAGCVVGGGAAAFIMTGAMVDAITSGTGPPATGCAMGTGPPATSCATGMLVCICWAVVLPPPLARKSTHSSRCGHTAVKGTA